MLKRISVLCLAALLLLSLMPSALADRDFQIGNKVTLDNKGRAVITWTDSDKNGPYTVAHQYETTLSNVRQTLIRDAVDVQGNRCAIWGVIPGKTYTFCVWDKDNKLTEKTLRVPTKPKISSSRKSKTTLTPVYSPDGSTVKKLKTLSASAMTAKIEEGYRYGLEYRTEFYSKAKKEIKHEAVFALYAPNGFVGTNYAHDFTLPKAANKVFWYPMLGSTFFEHLLDSSGSIPEGGYKFEVYLEGQLFYTKSFTVKP